MSGRVLVAGVGNLFLGDDGFGVEVTRRLAGGGVPDGVRVSDFGVGAVHLAYELLDGWDELILVDAAPRGAPPGTIHVLEHVLDGDTPAADHELLLDAHSMTPDAVLELIARSGARIGHALVVGCEPASVEEGIGLSEPVAAAVEPAVEVVRGLIDQVLLDAGAPAHDEVRSP